VGVDPPCDAEVKSVPSADVGELETGKLSLTSLVPGCQDKFGRLASLEHLKVDWDVVRGMSLRESLQQCGRLWLSTPEQLDDKARARLWNKSRKVEKFDMFLSHTWRTRGLQKMLSLLLQAGYPTVLLFWLCSVSTAYFLLVSGWLPAHWRFQVQILDFQASCESGPWILVASFVSVLLGMLVFPYLPNMCREPDVCFLDVASIHQKDQELMERGVYGIGGFLSITSDLRVLWSPPYLSRLWCVFELAAYRKANPTGKITLTPLYVEMIAYGSTLMNFMVACAWWTSRVYSGEAASECVSYAIALVPCSLAMHFLRKTYVKKHQLLKDLENFDLNQVHCSNDFDKEFIHAAIVEWYGSKEAFTAFVRGPLREELLVVVESCPRIAYPLFVTTQPLASGLTLLAALHMADAPFRPVASYVFGSFLAYNVCWQLLSLKFIMYLCDRFAEAHRPGFCDACQTVLIFLAGAGVSYAAAIVSRIVRQYSLWASLIWFVLSLTALCLQSSSRYLHARTPLVKR